MDISQQLIDRHKANWFGALRLLFACLVIASHAPQLIDGPRSVREPLSLLVGTTTLGQLAVDAFIAISGYLVIGSWIRSRSSTEFLKKRVLRIVPGFFSAFLICVFLVAPIGGSDLSTINLSSWLRIFTHMLILDQPGVPGAFERAPIPLINGAMWTVGIEFRCYLIAMILGTTGILRNIRVYSVITALVVVFSVYLTVKFPELYELRTISLKESLLFENAPQLVRLLGLFLVGGLLKLAPLPSHAPLWTLIVSGLGLICALLSPVTAAAGLAAFGPWIVIGVGRRTAPRWAARLNDTDVSYGVYLYAWPISQLALLLIPGLSPTSLFLLTLPLAILAGYLSWIAIEKPSMQRGGKALSERRIRRS